jgi:hypothetical protein
MDRTNRLAARYGVAFLEAVRSDWPIYAAAAAYVFGGFIVVAGMDHMAFGALRAYFKHWTSNFGILGPIVVTLGGILHIIHRLNHRRGLAFRHMFAPHRVARFLAGTLLMLTAMLMFTAMFSSIKTSFPLGRGFPLDVAHADLDQMLHFGVDPWRLLYAVAQHPWVLRAVEINYNMFWFIICYFTLYWVATSPRANRIRVRFMLSWFITWILVGNVVAGTWLSAGPAFYGLVTGDTERFAGQLAFLMTSASETSSATNLQSYLWQLYEAGRTGFGSGISAFPSMHVALIVLITLYANERFPRFGLVMWGYTAFVMMSSVYLGWHYAIDGYVSLVMVVAIYWALRKGMPLFARLRWKAPAAQPQPIPAYARNI